MYLECPPSVGYSCWQIQSTESNIHKQRRRTLWCIDIRYPLYISESHSVDVKSGQLYSFFPLASIWDMHHASVRDSARPSCCFDIYASDDGCSRGSSLHHLQLVLCNCIQYNQRSTHVYIFYISMCARINLFASNTQQPCCPSDRYQSVGGGERARVACVFLKTWNIILFFRHTSTATAVRRVSYP